MLNTLWAVVSDGKIQLLEEANLKEGETVLMTLLTDPELRFWEGASQAALDTVWNNAEDDVYVQLLAE